MISMRIKNVDPKGWYDIPGYDGIYQINYWADIRKKLGNGKYKHLKSYVKKNNQGKRLIERNITDCKIEIRILKNYTTAYDPDKVIEELKDSTVEFELFGTCSDYVEINHAIEIIKRGGGTDKDEK